MAVARARRSAGGRGGGGSAAVARHGGGWPPVEEGRESRPHLLRRVTGVWLWMEDKDGWCTREGRFIFVSGPVAGCVMPPV